MDWAVNIIRWLCWELCKAAFYVLDESYKLIVDASKLNILKMDELWRAWGAVSLFLGLAILIRVGMMAAKVIVSEEDKEGFNWQQGLIRVMLASMMLVCFVPAMKAFGTMGQAFVSSAGDFAGASANTTPSGIIVTGFINKDIEAQYQIQYNDYTVIDINDKVAGEYKYFPQFYNILLCTVFSLGMAVVVFMGVITICKKWVELAMILVVSPIPISALIDPKSDTFGVWIKMIGSVYITNFFSVLLIMLTMILCTSKAITSTPVFIQFGMMIAGMFVVLGGVPQLQRLIGGDTGGQNALQQLFYVGSIASAGVRGAAALGRMGASVGSYSGAAGTYGVGRLSGGRSINSLYNRPGFFGQNANSSGTSVSSGVTTAPANPAAYGQSLVGQGTIRSVATGQETTEQGVLPVSNAQQVNARNNFFSRDERVTPFTGVSLARAGSKLPSIIANIAANSNPALRLGAKVVAAASSHAYAASINRLQRRRFQRDRRI